MTYLPSYVIDPTCWTNACMYPLGVDEWLLRIANDSCWFFCNAKNLLRKKNTRKIKEVQVFSRYAPMANLQHLQSLSVKKKPVQTHSISDYLYVHQRRDVSFMHWSSSVPTFLFPMRPWADRKNVINGGTWAHYKWPKINGFHSGYFSLFGVISHHL